MKPRHLLGCLAALTLCGAAAIPAQADRYYRDRYDDRCYDRYDRYYDRGYYRGGYDPYYDRGYYRDRYYDRGYSRSRTSISLGFLFDLGGGKHYRGRRGRW